MENTICLTSTFSKNNTQNNNQHKTLKSTNVWRQQWKHIAHKKLSGIRFNIPNGRFIQIKQTTLGEKKNNKNTKETQSRKTHIFKLLWLIWKRQKQQAITKNNKQNKAFINYFGWSGNTQKKKCQTTLAEVGPEPK